jgi:hypothetical protein
VADKGLKAGFRYKDTYIVNGESYEKVGLFNAKIESIFGCGLNEIGIYMLPTKLLNYVPQKTARQLFAGTIKDVPNARIIANINSSISNKEGLVDFENKLARTDFKDIKAELLEYENDVTDKIKVTTAKIEESNT